MTSSSPFWASDWADRTAVVIAPGPSLTEDDAALVRSSREQDAVRVLSVSNAWKLCATWADAFYAADRAYWTHYFQPMRKAGVPQDKMYTCCISSAVSRGINKVKGSNQRGLGHKGVNTGGNSGYMGVNLAYLFGARRIILLGFDMQLGRHGERHFDGDHMWPLSQSMQFDEWVRRFDDLAEDLQDEGVEVVNCSRRTALAQFQSADIESALNGARNGF